MNDMFLFSLIAVPICIASGSIAVLWALQSSMKGGAKATSCSITPVVPRLGKITSESKEKHVSFIRERLLRLMMIFERSVVRCFSFQMQSALGVLSCVHSSDFRTRVGLITAQEYFCGRQSRWNRVLSMFKAVLLSSMGYLLHGRMELQLAPEVIRNRSQQR